MISIGSRNEGSQSTLPEKQETNDGEKVSVDVDLVCGVGCVWGEQMATWDNSKK